MLSNYMVLCCEAGGRQRKFESNLRLNLQVAFVYKVVVGRQFKIHDKTSDFRDAVWWK